MTLTQVICAVPILLAACFAVCMALAARVQRTRQNRVRLRGRRVWPIWWAIL